MINSNIINFLQKKGYKVSTDAFEIIDTCFNWYSNKFISDFHLRQSLQGERYCIERTNFAKRCCNDEANLCEVIEINASGEENSENQNSQYNFINYIFEKNKFDTMFRKQLELNCALGTAGCYVRLENATVFDNGEISGGEIKLNYIDARGIIPLTIQNDEIIECAFVGENMSNTQKTYVLVIFNLNEKKNYVCSTYVFDELYKFIPELSQENLELGQIKPFAILRNAEVNNLDNMIGYGLPKIWNAIPTLKSLDLAYNVIISDLDKAEKIVMINELMCKFDKTGKPILNDQQKKLFVFLGEKLPEEKTLFQEYNPIIRIEETKNTIEFLLSILSMSFGFGTRKYTFENMQFTTATEAIMSKGDSMQELNKQRQQAIQYITDICRAAMWFSNRFYNTDWDLESKILIDFDDSIIMDKTSELESMRNDALSFGLPWIIQNYIKEKYNLSPEEAKKIYSEGNTDYNLEDDSE